MKYITQILYMVGIILFANYGFSQGNTCADAITINTSSFTLEITASNTASGTTPLPSCAGDQPDRWYEVEATATSMTITYTANSATGGIEPRIQFLTGSCNLLNEEFCKPFGNFTNTHTLNNLTIGELIKFRFLDNGGDENGTADFTITGIVLPLDLLSFEGRAYKDYNVLTWTAAQAINVDVAEIEVSTDGQNFVYEDHVGITNSDTKLNYSWTHMRPRAGVLYYRLKIVDLDGTYAYSDIITVDRSEFASIVNVFPNPTTDYISVSGMEEEDVAYVLRSDGVQLGIIRPNQQFDVSHLPSGIYYIRTKKRMHTIIVD